MNWNISDNHERSFQTNKTTPQTSTRLALQGIEMEKKNFSNKHLGGFNDLPGPNTARADHHLFDTAVVPGPDPLNIGAKPPLVHIMGVADVVAYHWFFAAQFTYFGHDAFLSR